MNQQKNFTALVEYVISLDAWARERHQQMTRPAAVNSVGETLKQLEEIEERAKSVGAEVGTDEQSAMNEAKAFFKAAEQRSVKMVENTLALDQSIPLVGLNIGAAHSEGVERLLGQASVTYAVISPLALVQNESAGDISYDSFERKAKLLSVKWTGKGLSSFLDGRKKPPPVVGTDWFKATTQTNFVTATLVEESRGEGAGDSFPKADTRRKLDALDHLRIKWETLKVIDGDVLFSADVLGQSGWTNIWARGGTPKSAPQRKGRTLEELLLASLDDVRKEAGERQEPPKAPAIEMVTPDVMGMYAKEPHVLTNARITS